ncbi:hypothetical protein AB1Y20_007088 [Prymnesium parvum]|uniref:Protein kinase domain-containing protein n=1 Tax=Prymnesium parvum TaxID=97485 RepID=A0AB34J0C0_PRYPA
MARVDRVSSPPHTKSGFASASHHATIRQALVPAAARISTTDSYANPKQLIRVDGTPVIIHVLKGLRAAGIERVVVTLGHKGASLAEEITRCALDPMRVDFVWCDPSSWKRGHASNILAARSMFANSSEPLLVVMSDHLFDWTLLRNLAATQFGANHDATALIDDSPELVQWAQKDHCGAHCQNGHCFSLVKVVKGEGERISRIGKKLTCFDALEAGAYAVRPVVFEVLNTLLTRSTYCTLADAMQVMAAEGRLYYLQTGEQDWFSDQTIASLASPATHLAFTAVLPQWREGASALLRSISMGTVAQAELGTPTPQYRLGATIGEGGTSVVRCAEAGLVNVADGDFGRALAVKVIRLGQRDDAAMCPTEAEVMWEVHVLQCLDHPHIVRVEDVIDVIDATYIVMERVEGPELHNFIQAQPKRRLGTETAVLFFTQMIAALHHAHERGFVHCDIKPSNVRLNKQCDHAVVTDWGLARKPGTRPESYMHGTPEYASPEQLTGYSQDSISGSRKLCSSSDVWSLGVVLFEMLTGTTPFTGECGNSTDLVRRVVTGRFSIPEYVPSEAAEVIHAMLQTMPCDRATFAELSEMKFLRGAAALLELRQSSCDETSDAERGLLKSKRSTVGAWRWRICRAMLLAFYTGLCVIAIWHSSEDPLHDAEHEQ